MIIIILILEMKVAEWSTELHCCYRSGFTRWEAAKAQVMTASAGICGSMVAVVFGATDASASWILPFTAGGFLHIALVSVLPELIREESRLESAKQLLSLVTGIGVMATLIICFD